jgi:mRNA-degrading endonuclease RelE of RelBE toxin-antitoxin system
MKREPYSGDTKPLRGKHQGASRRRVGSWRIIFAVKTEIRTVLVADITRRTSSTY